MNREQMIAWLTLEGWVLFCWRDAVSCPRLSKGPIVSGVRIWQWLGSYWYLSPATKPEDYTLASYDRVDDHQLQLLLEKINEP